jgi:hypothetical protein
MTGQQVAGQDTELFGNAIKQASSFGGVACRLPWLWKELLSLASRQLSGCFFLPLLPRTSAEESPFSWAEATHYQNNKNTK